MIFSKNIAVTALSTLVLTAFHANSAWALDFKTAYEAALQHDATILAERAAAQAAQERLPQALSQRRPSLSLSAGQNRNHLESQTANMLGQRSVSERYYDSNNAALQLRQPLYRPAILAQIKQARAQVQDADAVLDVNENDLLERVAQAYFDALLGQVQLDLASAQKTAFAAQLQSAQKGFAAGVGMRTDVDEAQARMDLAHAQVLQAQQALDLARRRLALLLGVPVAQLVQLADLDTQRFAPSAPVPTSAEQWIALAEESSPQLQALRARLRAAQAEVDKAQAGHKPTLDVVATVSRSDSDSVTSINTVYKQKYVGVQLNVPLYSGGYVSSTVRQALAEVQRMQQTLEAAQRDLSNQVYEQFSAMTEGVLRIAALEQAVRSAQQALLSSQKSLQAGARTTVDVLNAEQQLTVAQRDLAQARYGYVLAHLKLQMLAGQERMANVDAVNRWLKTQG
ncbi:MAG: TolC family outer membrane protein [Acidovorax sp.]|jgi:outer membrane protein/protease secretion system outer membrane protein|nr:TolC family outer membrane protein [Comamonas sp.]MBP8147004.1 TolC family outer membrane protein [Acidovorax sp.]MCZ2107583.1 TolC family outer membrane protein [Burkholderiales bacterium]HRL39291.1 TolC family outer membrane protein [Comamonas denitrificans]HRM66952.1 TolC family outer membrane protein [Comamonas denitrificans]